MLPPIAPPGVPPSRLSTIIGDCLTNARAALDYIIWELAQQYFDPPVDILNGHDRRIVSFPIVGTSADADFKDLAKRHIPADAVAEIRLSQPYNAGYESLGWLNVLVNIDKHRMPLLTIGQFDKMTVTLATPAIFFDLVKEPSTITLTREAATSQPPMLSDVQMRGEITPYVTWKDAAVPRKPVELMLEQIVGCVAIVVPRFDRFFPS